MSQSGSLTSGSGTGSVTFVTDAGTATTVAGVIQVNGGTGITTSGAGNIVLITATGGGGGGLSWQAVTSASNPVTLVKNTGYIAKGAGVVNFVLPAAAAIGDTFAIMGIGNLWTIAQNANQDITIGISTTTTGITGSVTATSISDCLQIVCSTANLNFNKFGELQGNPTIV